MPVHDLKTMTLDEWSAEGHRLFGDDQMTWRFICPVCGHIACVGDWKAAGAPQGAVAFACVGRWIEGSKNAFEKQGDGPCTYSGGGLFQLNPLRVEYPDGESTTWFDFAEAQA